MPSAILVIEGSADSEALGSDDIDRTSRETACTSVLAATIKTMESPDETEKCLIEYRYSDFASIEALYFSVFAMSFDCALIQLWALARTFKLEQL